MKLFQTSNMEIVKCCQSLFGCELTKHYDKFIRITSLPPRSSNVSFTAEHWQMTRVLLLLHFPLYGTFLRRHSHYCTVFFIARHCMTQYCMDILCVCRSDRVCCFVECPLSSAFNHLVGPSSINRTRRPITIAQNIFPPPLWPTGSTSYAYFKAADRHSSMTAYNLLEMRN